MTALAVVLLGLFGAAYEVVKERPIYRRERMVNLGIGPYLLSKVVVLFGFALVQCATLLGALALAVDLPKEAAAFGFGGVLAAPMELYVTLVLTALASILMGMFVSSISPNSNTVIYLILLVVFSQILLTGMIFPLPGPVKPASTVMLTRWSLEALGSTADMDALNEKTVSRIEQEVELVKVLTPADLGPQVAPLLESAGVELQPVRVKETIRREEKNPLELSMGYDHSREGLHFRWMVLGGFALAFWTLTYFTLLWRDREEG